jgi:hypothetical protein
MNYLRAWSQPHNLTIFLLKKPAHRHHHLTHTILFFLQDLFIGPPKNKAMAIAKKSTVSSLANQ